MKRLSLSTKVHGVTSHIITAVKTSSFCFRHAFCRVERL